MDARERPPSVSTNMTTQTECCGSCDCESPDYEKTYNTFWKGIVETDGVLDKDAVMRELSDFHTLIQNVPLVYDHATRGRITKPNTSADFVIREIDESERRSWNETFNEFGSLLLDVCSDNDGVLTKDNLLDALKSYHNEFTYQSL